MASYVIPRALKKMKNAGSLVQNIMDFKVVPSEH